MLDGMLAPANAAINHLTHHSGIVAFGREIKSFRTEEAARRTGIQRNGGTASMTGTSKAARDGA